MRRGFLVLSFLCACASPPEPQTPPASEPAPSAPEPKPSPPEKTAEPEPPPPPSPPPSTVKSLGKEASSDDTTMMRHEDCTELAKTLTKLAYDEQLAQLPKGMDEAKRRAAEERAADQAKKTGDDFATSCHQGLAGNLVRRAMLECLYKARDAKTFQDCASK